MMVEKWSRKNYFEIPRAPSEIPTNQPGQFSLSGQQGPIVTQALSTNEGPVMRNFFIKVLALLAFVNHAQNNYIAFLHPH